MYHKFKLSTVAYISSMDNYCTFYHEDGTNNTVRVTLNEIEADLEVNDFLRCHRQYLVNIHKIVAIDTHNGKLSLGGFESIPYSRSKKEAIKEIAKMYR